MNEGCMCLSNYWHLHYYSNFLSNRNLGDEGGMYHAKYHSVMEEEAMKHMCAHTTIYHSRVYENLKHITFIHQTAVYISGIDSGTGMYPHSELVCLAVYIMSV